VSEYTWCPRIHSLLYITEEVFKKMLQTKVKAASNMDALGEATNVHDGELFFEEKNPINYIGGYIIKQLHSKVVTSLLMH